MTRRARDEDVFDDELYDRRYYPRKVFQDGKGPRVPLMLTDAAAQPQQPAHLRRIAPSSAPGPPRLRADARGDEESPTRRGRITLRGPTNAWRYPVAANPDAWNAPFPLPGESPRDAYMRQLSTTPNRNYPSP